MDCHGFSKLALHAGYMYNYKQSHVTQSSKSCIYPFSSGNVVYMYLKCVKNDCIEHTQNMYLLLHICMLFMECPPTVP